MGHCQDLTLLGFQTAPSAAENLSRQNFGYTVFKGLGTTKAMWHGFFLTSFVRNAVVSQYPAFTRYLIYQVRALDSSRSGLNKQYLKRVCSAVRYTSQRHALLFLDSIFCRDRHPTSLFVNSSGSAICRSQCYKSGM